ncbi:MAG TPA: hypothetical protein VHR72_06015, partial [Gemmataceae bacterium]|nr:hypothetical protein [Gemmataceae bacterium]
MIGRLVMSLSFANWPKKARRKRMPNAAARTRIFLEMLEERVVPATYWWIGATSAAWNVATNWAVSED